MSQAQTSISVDIPIQRNAAIAEAKAAAKAIAEAFKSEAVNIDNNALPN